MILISKVLINIVFLTNELRVTNEEKIQKLTMKNHMTIRCFYTKEYRDFAIEMF